MGGRSGVFIILAKRQQNCQYIDHLKYRKLSNAMYFFGDLNRAKWISIAFDAEVTYIKGKFKKAEYTLKFTNHVVNDFIESINNLEDSYIIPSNLFGEQKYFNLIEIPFCGRNESKLRLWKFHEFTSIKFKTSVKWITKKCFFH